MNKITAKLTPDNVTVPEVGMGATERVGSDSYAYTIIEVKSPRRIVVQRDRAIRVDKNGLSESQDYRYERDPEGVTYTLSLRKNGQWAPVKQAVMRGYGFHIGHRRYYSDPSF